MADDAGRLLDNLKQIDALIFPETDDSAREALATLARISRICRGVTRNGQRVIQIAHWAEHQRVDHPNLKASLPELVEKEQEESTRENLANDARGIREPLAPLPTTSDHLPTTSDHLPTTSDQSVAEAAAKRGPSEAADRLKSLLKSEILKNAPTFKITMAQERGWAATADRMLRLDGRTEAEAVEVICFAQRDDFWRANVLSMDKVREKFDQLALKAKSNGNRHSQAERKSTLPECLKIGGPRAQSII